MGIAAAAVRVRLSTQSGVPEVRLPDTRLPALTWSWSATCMDRQAVLAAIDEQLRRHPEPDAPAGQVEHDDCVVRIMCVGDGWTG